MARFTITSFATFAGLLIAARGLAADRDPPDRLAALAELAADRRALDALLADARLTPLVREMEDHALHFTHPGPARDDAIALFWQVAPEAFAAPELVTEALDPERIADGMVRAIRASPLSRDFPATPLAEPFFRGVTLQALRTLRAGADT